MATITHDVRIPGGTPAARGAVDVQPRPNKPIKVWAALGVAFLVVEIIAMGGWFTSGQMSRTPAGPTPIPEWMKWGAHGWEVVGLFGYAWFLWVFLIRPWKQEGRIGLDGILCIVFQTMYWQDTLLNYFQPWSTYNTVFWNLGAWDSHILGWLSPHGNYNAEPLIWVMPIYVTLVFGPCIAGCWAMRKIRTRWPQISNFGLVLSVFGLFAIFDLIMEPAFLMLGYYTYAGAIRKFSIFAGHYYQFPMYEAIMWPATYTVWAALRFFKDDKGRTIAERGVDDLKVSERGRTVVRWLALTGVCNLIFMLFYSIPASVSGLHADPWPKDITKRSYLTDGLCGPHTTYACPGPGNPVNRPESRHVAPDGSLVPYKDTGNPLSGLNK